MKKLLLLPILTAISLNAMQMDVVSAENVKVIAHKNNIYVEDDNAAYRIESHRMNQDLRRIIAHKALGKFKTAGYMRVTKDSDEKYNVAAKVRGLGGTGPITAGVVNMAVRIGCWTGYLLAVTTPTVVGTALTGPAGGGAAAAATTTVLANVGGGVAVAAGIESLAMKASLATLLLPIPLP